MWTRGGLKEAAKEALRRNYWKIVMVSLILVLMGCETGGISFHKTVLNNSAEKEAEEWEEDGDGAAGKKSIVTVRKQAGSDEMTVEETGGGEFAAEEVKTGIVRGVIFGFIGIAIFLAIFAVVLAVDILLINPLCVGGSRFMIRSVEDVAQVKEIAYGFDHSYKNIVKVMFHRELRIFLWTLLFIIPGIIKMFEYYMVPYILADHPDMEYEAALGLSRDMMEGNKWNTFVLGLSFILWHILGAITAGIVEILYVQPYRSLTFAALYCHLRNTRVMNNTAIPVSGQHNEYGQYGMNGQYNEYGQHGMNGHYSENGRQW